MVHNYIYFLKLYYKIPQKKIENCCSCFGFCITLSQLYKKDK